MERLILLLLSPAIFAERLKTNSPNDEPFLPIHPVYPYSPKLIKRGAERESISHLTPELYAPKTDTKDTYIPSYSNSNDYQRDPYYTPDYNVYSKSNPSTAYPSYDGGDPYAYANLPYVTYNPYSAPYAVSPAPYPTSSYPNYYYQPSYYYPHYFNHGLYSPTPPSSSVDYPETSQEPETEREKDKKGEKPREDGTNRNEQSIGQFVDGGNYISGNSRDLDVQSSTYKTARPYNQLERGAKDLPIPLPKTTYRVISVAGQPVSPDYPLPAAYVKAQQMEQLTGRTLAKLLAQNDAQRQTGQSYENTKEGANQDAYNPSAPSYVTVPPLRTNTGAIAYVIKPDGIAKANEERANPQTDSPSRTTSSKNTEYSAVVYVRESTPQTVSDHSRATYVTPNNRDEHRDRAIDDGRPTDQIDEYDGYETPRTYGDASSRSESKQERNYENYQSHQSGSYQDKNFISATPQTSRLYGYRYSAYDSDQAQQPQNDKIDTDDGNFGAKHHNKG